MWINPPGLRPKAEVLLVGMLGCADVRIYECADVVDLKFATNNVAP
jgi:hypothetical protein